MSTFLKKLKRPSNASLQTPETTAESTKPVAMSQNACHALLSDDIVYAILTAASNTIKSDLDRRETLFALCRVCRVWSRAAQSLLFRHVFLQIRSPMMALLKIIDHKTERGRRLARSIQAATIKLSRYSEDRDPPALPMIHPRHLPALLCHMPNLCTLSLTIGSGHFTAATLTAISRGPRITALTLGHYHNAGMESPAAYLLYDVHPWPHLESVTLEHPDRAGWSSVPEGLNPPKLRLTHVAITYPSGGYFAELPWLTQHSKETLTHLSLVCGAYDSSSNYLNHTNLTNIRSLTLGHTLWSDALVKTLHTFKNLKELQFVSFMQIQCPFPSKLPDTIEHLVVTLPFLPMPNGQFVGPDMMRPAFLKTFIAIIVEEPVYSKNRHAYMIGESWSTAYLRECQDHGIITEIRRAEGNAPGVVSKASPVPVKVTGSEVPLRIRQYNGTFQPTPSQLDLTDFDIIIGGRNASKEPTLQPSPAGDSLLGRTGTKSHTPFASLRGLVSSWAGTKSTEHN